MSEQIKDKIKITIAFLLLVLTIVTLVNEDKKEETYQAQQVKENKSEVTSDV